MILADKLMQAGFALATRGGISFRRRHADPAEKKAAHRRGRTQVQEIENQYTSGLITDGERYNKVVDIWGQCGDDRSPRR